MAVSSSRSNTSYNGRGWSPTAPFSVEEEPYDAKRPPTSFSGLPHHASSLQPPDFLPPASSARTLCQKSIPVQSPVAKKWVTPADVRACFPSFKVNQTIKINILDVVGKTLALHVLANDEIKAQEPLTVYVHRRLSSTPCQIIWHSLRRTDGSHNVYIALEAFEVASAEFSDKISVSQNALPAALKGKLESFIQLSVLSMLKCCCSMANPRSANALITGSYQPLGTRRSSFFSNYGFPDTTFSYINAISAQQSLPPDDVVDLVIQRVDQTTLDKIHNSRWINGVDLDPHPWDPSPRPSFSKRPFLPPGTISLPLLLQPAAPALNASFGGRCLFAKDGKTGVLVLACVMQSETDPLDQQRRRLHLRCGYFICPASWLHRIVCTIAPEDSTQCEFREDQIIGPKNTEPGLIRKQEQPP
ncbi:hypothetical protein C8F04DRAFT_1180114 [Mycena alexandri]|uniref:Uncharacterized protein n=1 Tax=Mycena alexandri TaxID=1745969 RepID=A0AAD6T243_9AGAR|nr:hypothetical protein C8F04DRAFT_1180114 [Mycena alexandri]